MLDGLTGRRGGGLAGNRHGPDAEFLQAALDGRLAVAAVGGDGAGYPAGAAGDPLDGGDELRAVGGGAASSGAELRLKY